MKQPDGISLINPMPVVLREDVELVQGALLHSGYKTLPDSRSSEGMHRMRAVGPAVKTSNHMTFACVSSPYAETRALFPIRLDHMRTHFVVNAVMTAFVEQVEV